MRDFSAKTRMPTRSSAPSSPENGQFYYDTTLNDIRMYENGAWVSYQRVPTGAPADVSRVLGTAYQPNTDRPVKVKVTVNLPGGDGDAVDQIYLEISLDGSTSWSIVDEAYINFDVTGILGAGGQANIRLPLEGTVPAAWFYRVRRVTGTGTIIRTLETIR